MAKIFNDRDSVLNQMVRVSGSMLAWNIVNDDHAQADGHVIFRKTVELPSGQVTFVSLNRADVIRAAAKIEADEADILHRVPRFVIREVHLPGDEMSTLQVVYVQSGI